MEIPQIELQNIKIKKLKKKIFSNHYESQRGPQIYQINKNQRATIVTNSQISKGRDPQRTKQEKCSLK